MNASGATLTNVGYHNVQLASGTAIDGAGTLAITSSGTLRRNVGTGTVIVSAALDNAGMVQVDTGGLTLAGSVAQLAGNTLTGGSWQVAGTLDLVGGGNVTTLGGAATVSLDAAASFSKINDLATIQGTFQLSGGRNFTAVGALTSSGFINVAAGSSLSTASGQALTVTAGLTGVNGTLIASGDLLAQGGGVYGSGTVQGDLVNSGAAVRPGAALGLVGTLTVTGDYTQSGSGSLEFDVGGTAPGTGHDQLAVGGTATLGGAVSAATTGGYTPTGGENFQVVTHAARFGRSRQAVSPSAARTDTCPIRTPPPPSAPRRSTGSAAPATGARRPTGAPAPCRPPATTSTSAPPETLPSP